MFKILTVKEKVRVPPVKFGMPINESLLESLHEQLEGKLNPEIGIFLATTEIINVSEGEIVPEDGAIHYNAEFNILTYVLEINEIVVGEVVDTTDFGTFVRIGPFDALVHVSQLMNDKVDYNEKTSSFIGKKTKDVIKKGDIVRTRIVGISLGKSGRSKISLTMRQPGLGEISTLEKEKKQAKRVSKAAK